VTATVLLLAGCGHGDPRPASPDAPLSTMDGAELTRYGMADGTLAYLQTIDVRAMAIDQVTGDRDAGTPGAYYPGADGPRFRRITPAQMQHSCYDRYGGRTFSAVNLEFFEDYQASTPLSFPVKAGGSLLTGGSSPYGPVPGARTPYYRTVTLDALSWDARGVRIEAYHPDTGAPLNGAVVDAVVTYRYTDHPSYVLDHDPPNRYQLAGVRDDAHLLILTVTHATLADGARVLRQHGVRGDIVTFDGGVSTYLWSAGTGDLVKITNSDGALPHYLCVHAR
jgi:hypothetical protein